MKQLYLGLCVGICLAYGAQVLLSIANQSGEEFVVSPQEVIDQNLRGMSRSKLCRSCVEDMGQVLQEMPEGLRAMALVHEYCLDAVYSYLAKDKGGTLRLADKTRLQQIKMQSAQFADDLNVMIASGNKLVGLLQ